MNKIQIEELKKEELTELLRKIIREEAEKLQPDHEELITREEVAQLFHANKDTIKNWTMRGLLKGYYIKRLFKTFCCKKMLFYPKFGKYTEIQ